MLKIPAANGYNSIRCVQVIAGVLGRAGEEGRARRLEAADQGEYTFVPAKKLHMPGEGAESAVYPKTLKLGATIQDLEEADRPLEEIMAERDEQRKLERAERLAKAAARIAPKKAVQSESEESKPDW